MRAVGHRASSALPRSPPGRVVLQADLRPFPAFSHGAVPHHGGMRRAVLLLLTLVYLAGVAWMTLRPSVYDANTGALLWRALDVFARHDETSWITFARVEAAANVAMFVPMGMFPALLLPKRFWWVGIVVGFAATVGIETLQATYLSATRFSDPQDLVMNTLGAAIGAAFVGLVLPRRRRGRSRPRQGAASPVW